MDSLLNELAKYLEGSLLPKRKWDFGRRHSAQLDAAKQRLKEFRHIQLHSMSSQFLKCGNRDEAERFVTRVLRDTQGLFDSLRKYFV